jgi:predicted secreted protein
MSTRKWYLNEALVSVRRLEAVIGELTEDEVMACLDLESATQRRRSVTDRLIKRAISLFHYRLQEKYHHG